MDVYTPSGEGPWPLVVAFHGVSSALKDADSNTVVVERAAAEAMMVVAPSWIAGDPFPLMIDDIDMLKDASNCAVAAAQQQALDRGGDPGRTVTYGFSAGVGPALIASLEPSTAPVPGCSTQALPTPVSGVVLGDGEYFFHSENFDGAFRADPEEMQAAVALWTDPDTWPDDLEADYHLWVAEDGTAPRSIDDPSDGSGWLAVRDPDGSIRTDLERLGLLDDGVIDNVDSGRILELRLARAGQAVTLDEYPGGHTTADKVDELVGYLAAAATA